MRAPAPADGIGPGRSGLRDELQLNAQQFVLAALPVARAKDCLFACSLQAPAARRAGVSDQVIAAVLHRRSIRLSDYQADIVTPSNTRCQ
jgi:hypothetical protein